MQRIRTLVLAASLGSAACSPDSEARPDSTPPSLPSSSLEAVERASSADASSVPLTAPPGVARVQEPAEAAEGATVRVREFHPNGKLSTERSERIGPADSRTRVGPMKAWFESGQLRIEGGYDEQGKLSGHWRYWDERGALLREGDYANGLREGDWVEFHPSGLKRSEGLLHVGQNEGPWRYWHENGARMAEGSYVNNLREGAWTFWDESGAVDARLTGYSEKNVRVR